MKILNSKVEQVSVSQLKAHPENPRRGDLASIKQSIARNGFYGAVVAQRSTSYILAGNHRFIAACELGAKFVPVVWVDVGDEQAKRILLADNRSSDLGAYDEESLIGLLEQLSSTSEGLLGSGYQDDDLEEMLQDLTVGVAPLPANRTNNNFSKASKGHDDLHNKSPGKWVSVRLGSLVETAIPGDLALRFIEHLGEFESYQAGLIHAVKSILGET